MEIVHVRLSQSMTQKHGRHYIPDRQTDKTGRQRDRQAGRETGRQRGRQQTDRQTYILLVIQKWSSKRRRKFFAKTNGCFSPCACPCLIPKHSLFLLLLVCTTRHIETWKQPSATQFHGLGFPKNFGCTTSITTHDPKVMEKGQSTRHI